MNSANSFPFYVVDFDPFAFRLPEGFFLEGVRWYGLSYLTGFVIALLLLNFYSAKKRSPLSKDDNSNLITYLLFGVIVGGRLGYMLLYDFQNLCANPISLFQIWRGGMASHGGFVGVLLATLLFARSRKTSFWTISDMIVTTATPGIFLGRIANFINGELWGKIAYLPWAMIFPRSAPCAATPIEEIPPRHPSQLYEAFGEGLFIFLFLQYRFWRCNLPKGQVSGEFLVLYGIIRIICEIFREPDDGISLIFGLSRGSFYSIFCVVAGIAIIAVARIVAKKSCYKK